MGTVFVLLLVIGAIFLVARGSALENKRHQQQVTQQTEWESAVESETRALTTGHWPSAVEGSWVAFERETVLSAPQTSRGFVGAMVSGVGVGTVVQGEPRMTTADRGLLRADAEGMTFVGTTHTVVLPWVRMLQVTSVPGALFVHHADYPHPWGFDDPDPEHLARLCKSLEHGHWHPQELPNGEWEAVLG
jgi:hypothetical protein